MPAERPTTAPLFDATVEVTRHAYGPRATPRLVTIITHSGLEIAFMVPPDWQPSGDVPIVRGVDCFAEVLATLVDVGHRVTRAALLTEMESRGRKRAESQVCTAIEDLMRLGIIDNRQDVAPKGYGIRGSD